MMRLTRHVNKRYGKVRLLWLYSGGTD